jgi:hypothetical protein
MDRVTDLVAVPDAGMLITTGKDQLTLSWRASARNWVPSGRSGSLHQPRHDRDQDRW